jgi:hypothetical protein
MTISPPPKKKPERADYPDDKSFEDAMMKYLHDTDQVVRPNLEPLTHEQLYGKRRPPSFRSHSPKRSGNDSGGYILAALFVVIGFIVFAYGNWAMWWTDATDTGFYQMVGIFMIFIGVVIIAVVHEIAKTKDPAFMARREKRRRYRENARRKKRGY